MSAGRQEAPGQRTRETHAEGQITGDKKQHSQAGKRFLGKERANNWAEETHCETRSNLERHETLWQGEGYYLGR
jgi:hypothetical protein